MQHNYLNVFLANQNGIQKTRLEFDVNSLAACITDCSPVDIVVMVTPEAEPFLIALDGFVEFCMDQEFYVKKLRPVMESRKMEVEEMH